MPTIRRFGSRDRASRFAGHKSVPADLVDRQRIAQSALAEVADWSTGRAPTCDTLEGGARRVLQELDLGDGFLGFTMVMVANAYWRNRLCAVPFSRRLLLLPRCLENVSADASPRQAALDRVETIQDVLRQAKLLGYRTLVADGTPIVAKVLAQSNVEAIIGVACLDSLEATFDKIWQLGVPSVAVPLLRDNCRNTSTDLALLAALVDGFKPGAERPRNNWLSLLQFTREMFDRSRRDHLLAPVEPRAQGGALDSAAVLGRDWVAAGGKRLRPFVTLAAASALAETNDPNELGDEACRIALAIEAFHKASLVHDDIEDDDAQRYGRPTLHRSHGTPVAINVGDYLLGLGYRLIAAAGAELPAKAATKILAQMSRAHVLLAQGQGAELVWKRDGWFDRTPADLLKVYALKTAPAFAAALNCGIALGGGRRQVSGDLEAFSRHLGVGVQLLNDLSDWAGDLRANRPTYLTALAVEAVDGGQKEQLLAAIGRCGRPGASPEALGQRYEELGVFKHAEATLRRLDERARELAGGVGPTRLKELCTFLVDLILG